MTPTSSQGKMRSHPTVWLTYFSGLWTTHSAGTTHGNETVITSTSKKASKTENPKYSTTQRLQCICFVGWYPSNDRDSGEFHFRWLEISVNEIDEVTTISLILHHLNRNLSQTFVGNVVFHTYEQLKSVDIQRHESNRLQHKENQNWILQCTNEKLTEENKQLKKQNSKERIKN